VEAALPVILLVADAVLIDVLPVVLPAVLLVVDILLARCSARRGRRATRCGRRAAVVDPVEAVLLWRALLLATPFYFTVLLTADPVESAHRGRRSARCGRPSCSSCVLFCCSSWEAVLLVVDPAEAVPLVVDAVLLLPDVVPLLVVDMRCGGQCVHRCVRRGRSAHRASDAGDVFEHVGVKSSSTRCLGKGWRSARRFAWEKLFCSSCGADLTVLVDLWTSRLPPVAILVWTYT
jgi:hypothetical protein